MSDIDARRAQFEADMANLRARPSRTGVETVLQIVGAVAMVGGIVLAIGAYSASLNVAATPGRNVDVLNSNSDTILAVAGLATSVVGGFVFLRYSLARFFRFWLLRQIHEQRVALDQATSRSSD